jgi:CheY-like chemotaxis protein
MYKKRILVIDDNQGMLFVIRKALEIKKYDVRTSVDFCGIAWVEEISPDMLFLDVSLDDKDGCEVSREIKSNESTKNIPIIILTGYSNGPELARGALAQGHLSKPFDLLNLWATAANILKN